MMFDVVLPSIITIIAAATVLLYAKVEQKIRSAFEEKELGVRDVVFLVIGMGIMVTIIALVPLLIPQQAIRALFLVAYSFILFLFTYVVTEKWYFALLPSAIFVALYLSPFWNLLLLNIFAIIFAAVVTVYLGSMFSWKTVIVFAALITVMDFIQVFGTGFMGASAENLLNLELPIMLIVPTFPVQTSGFLGLGLGDVFLTGLLAIQTAQKYGRNAGFISAVAVGIAFFVFEFIIFFYHYTGFFPATLVVMGGWLLGFGGNLLISRWKPAS